MWNIVIVKIEVGLSKEILKGNMILKANFDKQYSVSETENKPFWYYMKIGAETYSECILKRYLS